MEWREQDGRMLNPSLQQSQADTVQTERGRLMQDPPATPTGVMHSDNKPIDSPCHAVIRARPFYSPEYSPDFHKSGSAAAHSTAGALSDICAPLQPSAKKHVPFSEKRRLLDKQEEIQEVKQLDDWKPAVSIFTTVLKGLEDKAS